MSVLLALCGALCVAAAVWASWWLGVRGFLLVLLHRVQDLEDAAAYQKARLAREAGREGRGKQLRARTAEEQALLALEEAAARERGKPSLVDRENDVELDERQAAAAFRNPFERAS